MHFNGTAVELDGLTARAELHECGAHCCCLGVLLESTYASFEGYAFDGSKTVVDGSSRTIVPTGGGADTALFDGEVADPSEIGGAFSNRMPSGMLPTTIDPGDAIEAIDEVLTDGWSRLTFAGAVGTI